MRKYRFLDHTADAKFQSFGQTLEEAFGNAALATASLMWDYEKVAKRINHPVDVEGRDLKQLLVAFLEELLYLLDSKRFLLNSVDGIRIDKKENRYGLKAQFWGDSYSNRHKIFGSVKAITYNEMNVEKKDHFIVQVVVDI